MGRICPPSRTLEFGLEIEAETLSSKFTKFDTQPRHYSNNADFI